MVADILTKGILIGSSHSNVLGVRSRKFAVGNLVGAACGRQEFSDAPASTSSTARWVTRKRGSNRKHDPRTIIILG